ncbi:MAG: hypothetical protein LW832_07170 [Parachlamydia sp.]|jgi:hypothetical protein|nr:hypothetical protein [Parachlamydia sp.]
MINLRLNNHNQYEDREHRLPIANDTIFAIAGSIFAWLGAEVFERHNPALSATLKLVPAFAFAIWLIKRIPHSNAPYVHTPDIVHDIHYVAPAPVYQSRWNRVSNLFNNFNFLPSRRHHSPPRLHNHVTYAAPHVRENLVTPAPISHLRQPPFTPSAPTYDEGYTNRANPIPVPVHAPPRLRVHDLPRPGFPDPQGFVPLAHSRNSNPAASRFPSVSSSHSRDGFSALPKTRSFPSVSTSSSMHSPLRVSTRAHFPTPSREAGGFIPLAQSRH